jgi:hypothetical protein
MKTTPPPVDPTVRAFLDALAIGVADQLLRAWREGTIATATTIEIVGTTTPVVIATPKKTTAPRGHDSRGGQGQFDEPDSPML